MPNKPSKFLKTFKLPLFILSVLGSLSVFAIQSYAQAPEKQPIVIDEVRAGDTLKLQGGMILKYAGVSAPSALSSIPLVKQYGVDALEYNKRLVTGKRLLVEWGSQIRDDRRNLLGYVFLEDGTFVNAELIKAGQVRAVITPPNTKYAATFHKLELEARRSKRGLWKQEPDNPYLKSEYIGEKNTKIFYFPDSPELDRIPQANLVKFRSRVEATAAGYRACFTCSEALDTYNY